MNHNTAHLTSYPRIDDPHKAHNDKQWQVPVRTHRTIETNVESLDLASRTDPPFGYEGLNADFFLSIMIELVTESLAG